MIFSDSAGDRKVRVFSLSQSFLDEFKDQKPDWGPIGLFTYRRTYARTKEDGTVEDWWETCQRVVEGCFNIQKVHCKQMGLPWDEPKAQGSAQEMYTRMFEFKFTPPGRGLWMMGTDLVYERGSAALQNCSFISSENIGEDFAGPFTYLMDLSMLGVGVGGDTRGAGKARVQQPKVDGSFDVADSREGWVDLLRTVLNSFVGKGGFPSVINYEAVRGRGEPIKGFGGTASGPAPLQEMIEGVTRILLPEGVECAWDVDFDQETGKIGEAVPTFSGEAPTYRIDSTRIVDVFNFVGKCVVAGGVRRSAEIMFGEPDDESFLALKQDDEALTDRRWVSNNSVFGYVGMDYTRLVKALSTNGEPGIFWVENARKFGRLMDKGDNADWRIQGTNPCGEIGLESAELCNLVETFPAHHDSYADFERTLKMAYLYAKTVTLVPTHDPRANQVMQRNRRIGCSMSGIAQALGKMGRHEFLKWCDRGYDYVQRLDKLYSGWLGIPLSIKTTTVKPSGTVSLLCGATPGIHYPHSEFYIRHVRVANTSILVDAAKRAGYAVHDDPYATDTSVVAFPVQEKNFVKGKRQVSIWQQFTNAVDIQRHWADNAVSVTVSFKPEEKADIKECLEAFDTHLKGVSLMPLGDDDHGYLLAPYVEITKEEYETMMKGVKPLDVSGADHEVDDEFCDGDKCMIG